MHQEDGREGIDQALENDRHGNAVPENAVGYGQEARIEGRTAQRRVAVMFEQEHGLPVVRVGIAGQEGVTRIGKGEDGESKSEEERDEKNPDRGSRQRIPQELCYPVLARTDLIPDVRHLPRPISASRGSPDRREKCRGCRFDCEPWRSSMQVNYSEG